MGKSGKLFSSLVNGVKALKSPSTREKSTKENSHASKERDSSVSKQRCMWSLGKSSSRNKNTAGVPLHPGFEVKDVQVQPLSQASLPPASSFHYTDAYLYEITSTLADEIVREETPPHESYQEDWATILKLSDDESEPEQYHTNDTQPEQYHTHDTQPEEQAAVRIQAAIRRYLVQQKFKRASEAVIRLQAVARGRMVRKQAATTLRCIHALVKFQANARGWLVRTSEVGQRIRQRLEEIRLQDSMQLEEEFQSKQQSHSQPIAFALDEQICIYSSKQSRLVMDFEPDKEHWGWAWLDRWMTARPWENSSSRVAKEKPRITASDGEAESNSMVEEGAEIIVSNLEKQNESASGVQMDRFISSALQEIPLPPPPPPLPSFIKAAHTLIKDPVLCATSESASLHTPPITPVTLQEVPLPPPPPPPPPPPFIKAAHPSIKHPVLCATSESASLHTPHMTPVTTEEFSESASLCTPATTPIATELATPNITTESAPSVNEGNLVSSTSGASETSLPTLVHAEESEEITLLGTPVALEALQAEVAINNPSVGESLPPAQQSESFSSSSFTMKEEDWRQDSTPVPWHIADSQGEGETGEPGENITNVLSGKETAMGTSASEVWKHDDTSASGTRDGSISSNAEAGNYRTAEEEETVKNRKGESVEGSTRVEGSIVQVKGNGLHEYASATPIMLSEATAKRMGSILVKHEQGEGVSQSIPSYMATTKSSKAKTRSQASPKPIPESPKQRLVSPKHSSGSKRTPASEGKGSFTNSRQIVHVRAGSKGQLTSPIIKDGSTDHESLAGDSRRHIAK